MAKRKLSLASGASPPALIILDRDGCTSRACPFHPHDLLFVEVDLTIQPLPGATEHTNPERTCTDLTAFQNRSNNLRLVALSDDTGWQARAYVDEIGIISLLGTVSSIIALVELALQDPSLAISFQTPFASKTVSDLNELSCV